MGWEPVTLVDSGNMAPNLNAGWGTDYTGQLAYCKIGRVVYVIGKMIATQTSPPTTFMTLPVGFRPSLDLTIGKAYSYSYPNYYGHFQINTDGRCVLHSVDMGSLPSGTPVWLNATFLVSQ